VYAELEEPALLFGLDLNTSAGIWRSHLNNTAPAHRFV
jgi:hypothetical protein